MAGMLGGCSRDSFGLFGLWVIFNGRENWNDIDGNVRRGALTPPMKGVVLCQLFSMGLCCCCCCCCCRVAMTITHRVTDRQTDRRVLLKRQCYTTAVSSVTFTLRAALLHST